MAYCRVCKAGWEEELESCPICGRDLDEEEQSEGWILLGTIEDKVTADLAREVLKSSKIPAVVMSRSGYFGEVGLTFRDFYSGQSRLFEVSVPEALSDEAADILDATVGEQWKRRNE